MGGCWAGGHCQGGGLGLTDGPECRRCTRESKCKLLLLLLLLAQKLFVAHEAAACRRALPMLPPPCMACCCCVHLQCQPWRLMRHI